MEGSKAGSEVGHDFYSVAVTVALGNMKTELRS